MAQHNLAVIVSPAPTRLHILLAGPDFWLMANCLFGKSYAAKSTAASSYPIKLCVCVIMMVVAVAARRLYVITFFNSPTHNSCHIYSNTHTHTHKITVNNILLWVALYGWSCRNRVKNIQLERIGLHIRTMMATKMFTLWIFPSFPHCLWPDVWYYYFSFSQCIIRAKELLCYWRLSQNSFKHIYLIRIFLSF